MTCIPERRDSTYRSWWWVSVTSELWNLYPISDQNLNVDPISDLSQKSMPHFRSLNYFTVRSKNKYAANQKWLPFPQSPLPTMINIWKSYKLMRKRVPCMQNIQCQRKGKRILYLKPKWSKSQTKIDRKPYPWGLHIPTEPMYWEYPPPPPLRPLHPSIFRHRIDIRIVAPIPFRPYYLFAIVFTKTRLVAVKKRSANSWSRSNLMVTWVKYG